MAKLIEVGSFDHKNTDLIFGDNPLRMLTERFADLLRRELTSTVSDEDFMFDVHRSPSATFMQPQVAHHGTRDQSEQKSRTAAEATNKVVCRVSPTPDYIEKTGERTKPAVE